MPGRRHEGRKFGRDLGRRIQGLRESRGWTQERLAEALGITKSIVSRYEGGAISPGAKTLTLLGSVLGVSVDYLLGAALPERPIRLDDDLSAVLKEVPGVPRLHRNSLARLIRSFLDHLQRSGKPEPAAPAARPGA
ncbi:MAG TPA: helix-turn-helix transcriptional regulator [Thermoanaerobaculia bacterium]|nr:helix-turn-helix transcriptional regulator [Thermoanaerobaculia bacterium]